jgi:hypothetical protein
MILFSQSDSSSVSLRVNNNTTHLFYQGYILFHTQRNNNTLEAKIVYFDIIMMIGFVMNENITQYFTDVVTFMSFLCTKLLFLSLKNKPSQHHIFQHGHFPGLQGTCT